MDVGRVVRYFGCLVLLILIYHLSAYPFFHLYRSSSAYELSVNVVTICHVSSFIDGLFYDYCGPASVFGLFIFTLCCVPIFQRQLLVLIVIIP